MPRKRLGEILIDAGKLKEEELTRAISEQRKYGEKLGRILVRLGILTEKDIVDALTKQLKVPVVNLDNLHIDADVLKLVPPDLAKTYTIIPIGRKSNVLQVATSDPLDITALDEISRATKMELEVFLATESEIKRALQKYYGIKTLVEETLEEITKKEELEEIKEEVETQVLDVSEEEPVIRLVNSLISQAISDNASDVHIEPYEKFMRIRMRIDGKLREIPSPPKKMYLPIVSRIKIMANMDIAKTRIPQDGRFDVKEDGKEVSIRVSTYPSIYGEKVVMRLLDKTASLYGIDRIGLLDQDVERLKRVIKKPYGFILATGPTGSGKTTTLYAILNYLNTEEKNIVTIEDPVEYTIENITQAQINVKAGFTFDQGLRAILRQDPDIIMVGEIRDRETAEVAIHAALTGHIVLSTFHTNDAPSALTRLIEMGIEPFLVASSVTCVIAQRLIRRLCNECKEIYSPPKEVLIKHGLPDDISIFRPKGCPNCKDTGYRGRIGIFEILIMDEHLRELVMRKASSDAIRNVAKERGMTEMKEDALKKVAFGITSLEEALSSVQVD
ncbi:MAG: ATPase, T2SS/T4P/T4SS family [Deltaproteobacteria bacterium]|nr:ATPase, T2SS/T4P/T4SS family [Deltaproteobacteria bacterium]